MIQTFKSTGGGASTEAADRLLVPGRDGVGVAAEHGYLHCGPNGAGHFVKMVHNGIEYGIMASYAQGLNILKHANAGQQQRRADAETATLRHPEHYPYDLNLPETAEVWRRGSVIASWILDRATASLLDSPDLTKFADKVLSALRYQFGGHEEKAAARKAVA
jgi:6-phosphogluconate dehydrogenase